MDYVVYSTSNSDYQSWQCKLLEHSFKKVKQPGKLIRLCSYNTHNSNRVFDTSDIAEIVKTPDYRTRWTEYTNSVDKDYGIVNKTESLKYWLLNYPGLNDTDTVLFIDPDMVFMKPVTLTVTPGHVIGQRWVDEGAENWGPFTRYASHIKGKVKNDTVFMYPYIATVGDLKKIVNGYLNLCYKMRLENYPHLWESEMFSLIISTLEQGIKVETLDNLGYCTTWANKEAVQNKEFVDSIHLLHYPSSMFDKNGVAIFNKQDYTPQTRQEHWNQINPEQSTTYLERKFLRVLDHYNLEKKLDYYWNKIELIDSMFDYIPQNKYVVFKPWPGGFNNIRMSLEIAACIAFIQNRILVLPPEYRMYLLDNTNLMSTFFDINDIGIKTMSFEEFENKFNVNGWDQIKGISYTIGEDLVNTLLTTTDKIPSEIIKGRNIKNITQIDNNQILYFDSNLLGNFYLNIYSDNLSKVCKYVARHIHYNKEIFIEAYKAVSLLGQYNAIHIRRNDFQYHDLKLPIETIYDNIKNVLPKGSVLYISTDEKDKDFFSLLKNDYTLFFYDDIKNLISLDINVDLIGPIEQIICTNAKTFIGNKLSTFSSYIYRLRGYMDNITDKRFLTYNVECNPDVEEDNWYMGVWAREYSQVFTSIKDISYFNPVLDTPERKRILVSIASYRDTQLTITIDSLFANRSRENDIIIGACMQDTEENYNDFKYKDHPDVRTHFIPYQEAKGVGYARNLIQQELFIDEDYFLQIDSHSRAIKDWDKILIKQINNCPTDKVILSTYPNGFDVLDEEEKYFKHTTCPYLKINGINESGKLNIGSAGVVENKPMLGFWCAAGFLFTKGLWCKEVEYSKDFYFSGEEDYASVMSYVKGWDVYVPESSTIWHDYTDNRIQSPKKYRPLHWEDHPGVDPKIELLKGLYKDAYGGGYKRTPEQFLELAKRISGYSDKVEIKVVFDWDKIPMHDTTKEIDVIIFAFYNEAKQEIYRPDIYDEGINNRTKNTVTFNITNEIHYNTTYCIWIIKYLDSSFGERYELPFTKNHTTYNI